MTPVLREDFLEKKKTASLRLIELRIDPEPLATLGQHKVSCALMGDASKPATIDISGAIKSFGQEHDIPVYELCLPELAWWYMNRQRELFSDADYAEQYDKKTGATTYELRLSEPEDVGEWCSFERYLEPNTGRRSIRYKLGRKCIIDAAIVAVVELMIVTNKQQPGLVNVYLKIETCFINGVFGYVTPPHQITGLLKHIDFKRKVIKYARENLPRGHHLIKQGWADLPADVEALPSARAVPA